MKRAVLAIVVALFLGGCAGRTLVVPPETVRQLNDPAWKISREPR